MAESAKQPPDDLSALDRKLKEAMEALEQSNRKVAELKALVDRMKESHERKREQPG